MARQSRGDRRPRLATNETCPTPPCPDRDWYAVLTFPYTSHEVVIEGVTPWAVWEPLPGGGSVFDPPSLSRHDAAGNVLQVALALGGTAVPSASASLRWETPGPNPFPPAPFEYITVAHLNPAACEALCDATAQYTVRFYETTGVTPRFNNAAGQVTVVMLENTMTADWGDGTHLITGNLNFFTGGPQTAPIQAPFTLLENTRLVLSTSMVPGLAGLAGHVTVTHDGRYGQLVGKATALEPATGFSFDSPLVNMPH